MTKLAIHGGKPVRTELFKAYNPIGEEEKKAVLKVLDSGNLSQFYGSYGRGFLGGPEVKALEAEWAEYFGAKHAIAVNSNTSGLICAAGAVGVGPGVEVITTPFSMMATATAVLVFNGVPVFADIEEEYLCLDPVSVAQKITPRTKAIFVTDICGQPYDATAINALAKQHGLFVVEDNAQAPFAKFKGKFAGTLGDIGIFSLNYHKHIHSGEGGIICTDNDELAEKMRMIRNHAESVAIGKIKEFPQMDLTNMVGFNFRMTEIEAAIARQQLKKLEPLVSERVENCEYLGEKLSEIPGIRAAKTRPDATHVYYVHPFFFDEKIVGVPKDVFLQAVRAELPATEKREIEGALLYPSFSYPIYLAPLYQSQMGFGKAHCPFQCPLYEGKADYSLGLCPVMENNWKNRLFAHELMRPPATKKDLDDVVLAFQKVWDHRQELLP